MMSNWDCSVHLKDIAFGVRRHEYWLARIAQDLPKGTTAEVVEAARMKLSEVDTALKHEADALERYADAEEEA